MKKTICCVLMVLFLSMAADTVAGGMWSSSYQVIRPSKNELYLASLSSDEGTGNDEEPGTTSPLIEYSNVIRIVISTPAPILTSPVPSTTPVDVDESLTRTDEEERKAQDVDGEPNEQEAAEEQKTRTVKTDE